MGRMFSLMVQMEKCRASIVHRTNEKRKIKDPRRVEILKAYDLSDEQRYEIDELYTRHYGKKISYEWHRLYASYTGSFDAKYIPELLFIPEIEPRFVPMELKAILSDKNLLPELISGGGIAKTAQIYLSCVNGQYRDSECQLLSFEDAVASISNIGEIFIKPTRESNSGRGCGVFEFKNGYDLNSGASVNDILKSAGTNFNIQEVLRNCHSVSKLHPHSLNTFRITTYIWDNKIWHFPVLLRIGQGKAVLDNAHQGGMFIGVSDDGVLRKEAYTEFQERYTKHPDTGIVFDGYTIPEIRKAIWATERLHSHFPQVGMISWDIVIDHNGMVNVVEMNLDSQSVWLSQMANGIGAFGANTEAILKWISKKK